MVLEKGGSAVRERRERRGEMKGRDAWGGWKAIDKDNWRSL